MTIELLVTQYSVLVLILMITSPWIAYYLCVLIPGKSEEPYILSVNFFISAISCLILSIYLAYSLNSQDWRRIGQEANLFLLLSVPYHLLLSIHLSKKRLPLKKIPAFRIIQGAVVLAIVFLALSSILQKIRIIFFSYLPFNTFLMLIGALIFIGYLGWLELFGEDEPKT